MSILDERSCISVEIDRLLRVEKHGLLRIHLHDEVLEGTESDHVEEFVFLILRHICQFAGFCRGFLSLFIHLLDKVIGIYDCSLT